MEGSLSNCLKCLCHCVFMVEGELNILLNNVRYSYNNG